MSGLLRPVKMEPDPAGRRYWDTNLPHPGFTPGANIHLRAAGAALAPFSLSGWASPRSPSPRGARCSSRVSRSSSPGLRAPPVPRGWRSRSASTSTGVTPSTLVCETPDVGRFEIAADQVSKLLAAGASGYPKALLSRQTVDAVTLTPGCVELMVSSPISRSLTVSGHTPCRIHSDCPPTAAATSAPRAVSDQSCPREVLWDALRVPGKRISADCNPSAKVRCASAPRPGRARGPGRWSDRCRPLRFIRNLRFRAGRAAPRRAISGSPEEYGICRQVPA